MVLVLGSTRAKDVSTVAHTTHAHTCVGGLARAIAVAILKPPLSLSPRHYWHLIS